MADSGSYDEATLARRYAMAQKLMEQGQAPVTHWAQGLANLANSALGGYEYSKADEERRAEKTKGTADLYGALGLPPPTSAPDAPTGGFQKLAALLSGGGASAPTPSMPDQASYPPPPAPGPPPITFRPGITSPVVPPVDTTGKIYSNNEPSPLDPPVGADRAKMMATILGEAGNEPQLGKDAVASVIRTRAVDGGYGGDTPSAVVTAKNQFEPWNTEAGKARMAQALLNPAQAAAADAAIKSAYGEGGKAPNDPTEGMTHFYSPGGQAALGRSKPAWAGGDSVTIGGHVFNSPDDKVPANAAVAQGALPTAEQAAAPPGVLAGVAPETKIQIAKLLSSNNPAAKAIGASMLQQASKPTEFGFQTLPDGTIVKTNPRTGTVEPTYQAPTKQTFGVIGEDENGKKTYGFIDAAKGKTTPIETAKPGDERPTVTGPDGKEIVIPKGVDVATFKKEVSRASADAATGKMTEVQGNAVQFANRMEAAQGSITPEMEKNAVGLAGAAQGAGGAIPLVGGPWLQSQEYQKYSQAKSQFITSVLRKESGAAISKEEFKRYDNEFFPQPGDKPETIAQKAQERKVAVDAMKRVAGPSYKSPDLAKPTTAPVTKSIGGKEYYQENGQWFEK
jgi:hypothetical protein